MKTKILTSVILVLMSVFSVKAQPSELGNSKVDVQLTQSKQMRIIYMDAANEKVSFKIMNDQGEELEARTYKADSHLKIDFRMDNMPNGTYDVLVYSNRNLVRIERIEIQNGKLARMPQLIKSETITYALI
jgi:hypothetical protein